MGIEPIAYIQTDFSEKFGIPRQSGLADSLQARIVFEPQYRNRDALRGLEEFSHIWLLWEFSANRNQSRWQPTVRPPRLGGNRQMGVFATRSPYRPNPIGLSCVSLEFIDYECADGPVIYVKGADLMDGTPIYDIKPYVPYADCMKEATGGYTDNAWRRLDVSFPQQLRASMSDADVRTIIAALQQDPRPHYHNDDTRIYGMPYRNKDIKFCVKGKNYLVISDERQVISEVDAMAFYRGERFLT